ncbi:Ger(x)C family spore germination protein [Clostridium sediminicola]|uniref:Ger(x)C family spore germination protein n=1 Tax=Clostridium sediminicola TaxID=3114879 RepID=UPI0031F2630B
MIRKQFRLLIICLCSILLTGCWDYEDINDKCIVISLGVDYFKDNIEFSGEIVKLTSSTDNDFENAQGDGVYRLLSYGKTFEEARLHYDAINPFPVFLGSTRVVVFGKRYAEKGIEPYLNRIDHIYNYRKTLLTVVCRESPKEMFSLKQKKDISVGYLIEDILNHLAKKGGALNPNVGEILSDIAFGNIGYLLPYVGVEKGTIKYLGYAVMKDSKLIGIIDLENTDGILYVLSEKPTSIEVIQDLNDEKKTFSFRTFTNKRKINVDYLDKRLNISIDMDLSAQLRYQYYTGKVNGRDIKELENMLSDQVKKDIVSNVERAQKEFQCDIFGFARYFRAEDPKTFQKIDWENEFINANVNVTVNTKIINRSFTDPNAEKKY